LLPGTLEWLNAFWELSTDRQIGMGVGAIPASAITEWAARAGLDDIEAESFRSCIRAMDRAYLDFANKPDAERHKVESRPMTGELFDALFS
jgi:hypothetical protein